MNKLYLVKVHTNIKGYLTVSESVNANSPREAKRRAEKKARISLLNRGLKPQFSVGFQIKQIGGDFF